MRAVMRQERVGAQAFRLGVVAAALVLVAGACSSDRSDEDPGGDEARRPLPTCPPTPSATSSPPAARVTPPAPPSRA